ncbi:MAG: BlaI/MecI/CopY family transcriptional regulator [Proteobacteria bacterium]|nr:BlaI/MecI/CopY family transcriptional regulator [Pseudomonadota bacterium]
MQLSNSEMLVLDVLWRESPLTVGQVIERVQRESDWHVNAIKQAINRRAE